LTCIGRNDNFARGSNSGGQAFAQIVIRNIEPAVKDLLERRAKRYGRSLVEEINAILRDSVKEERRRLEARRHREGLGTAIARRFAEIGFTNEEAAEFERHLDILWGRRQPSEES
jgi:plasmid stability protein